VKEKIQKLDDLLDSIESPEYNGDNENHKLLVQMHGKIKKALRVAVNKVKNLETYDDADAKSVDTLKTAITEYKASTEKLIEKIANKGDV